jgi:hypothetical protein
MTTDNARNERAMMWYNQREQIETKAHELFTLFLLEKGFVQRKEIRDVFGTSLRYAAEQIGIRVRVDFRDQFVDIEVLRVRNRGLPKNGVYYEGQERVAIPLAQVVTRRLHLQDQEIDRRRDPDAVADGLEDATVELTRWYGILSRHIDQVLANSPEALFPPRQPR